MSSAVVPIRNAWQRSTRRNHAVSASIDILKERMQDGLIALYGYGAQFKSDMQEQSCKAVLRNRKALVVVMGTSHGKSLLFQLTAVLSRDGTVLVIVPFRALVNDLVQRCSELGLDTVEWTRELKAAHQLIIVSADLAIQDSFMHFAASLNRNGLIRHIFIDECHVSFTDIDYRAALRDLSRIRDLDVPLTLLTATLPPSLEWDLRRNMAVPEAEMVR